MRKCKFFIGYKSWSCGVKVWWLPCKVSGTWERGSSWTWRGPMCIKGCIFMLGEETARLQDILPACLALQSSMNDHIKTSKSYCDRLMRFARSMNNSGLIAQTLDAAYSPTEWLMTRRSVRGGKLQCLQDGDMVTGRRQMWWHRQGKARCRCLSPRGK